MTPAAALACAGGGSERPCVMESSLGIPRGRMENSAQKACLVGGNCFFQGPKKLTPSHRALWLPTQPWPRCPATRPRGGKMAGVGCRFCGNQPPCPYPQGRIPNSLEMRLGEVPRWDLEAGISGRCVGAGISGQYANV